MKFHVPLNSVAAFAALLFLTSCSEAPAPTASTEGAKEAAKPAEPGPAKQAFWKMYKPIREWSKDVQLLSMASKEIPTLKGASGKEAAWVALFVSAAKHEARTVTYSEVDSGDLHKGVAIEATQPWGGPTRESQPIQNQEFGTDSDAAYKTAAAKADPWLKTHPNEKLTMFLAKSAKNPTPVWIISWGDKTNGFLALVNATSGDLISPK